ncbi:MAG: sodium-independent anion transporter [Chitinophagaceae bacterium]
MQVKIDTKEKIYVITIQESELTANMTEEIQNSLLSYLEKPTKNVILDLQDINNIDDAAAETLINIQQGFYEQGASFVICSLQQSVIQKLDSTGLLEIMNEVPTQTEAIDIVHLEEIERELLEGDL